MPKSAISLAILALAFTVSCTHMPPQTAATQPLAPKIIAEKDLTTYLFVYFKDDTHIPITTDEAKTLAAHWKLDFDSLKQPVP